MSNPWASDYGYGKWDRDALILEAERLKGEFKQLESRVGYESEDIQKFRSDVDEGWIGTGVGAALAVGGLVVGASTPLGIVIIFGSVGLSYWSGKKCFEASANCSEKEHNLERLNQEFREIARRLSVIKDLLRKPE